MEGLRDKLFEKVIKLQEETNMMSALLLMLTTVIENGKQEKPDDDSSSNKNKFLFEVGSKSSLEDLERSDEDSDDDSIGSDADSIQACDIKFA